MVAAQNISSGPSCLGAIRTLRRLWCCTNHSRAITTKLSANDQNCP